VADARDGLVVEIVERLDGIPLAIELAAARTRTMELGELRDRLDDRFRLLSGGSRRSGQRQATLDGAFALDAQHSRRLLNEELDRWSLTRRPIDKPTARPT
jgi:predicted ATPase